MSLTATRLAVNFDPPQFVVEYRDGGKVRHRIFNIQENVLQKKNEIRFVGYQHYEKHIEEVFPNVLASQVNDLFEELCVNFLRIQKEKEEEREKELGKDYNKLSDLELKKVKQQMDEDFEKRKVRKGDANFVYDKQVDFQPMEPSGWDSD